MTGNNTNSSTTTDLSVWCTIIVDRVGSIPMKANNR